MKNSDIGKIIHFAGKDSGNHQVKCVDRIDACAFFVKHEWGCPRTGLHAKAWQAANLPRKAGAGYS